MIKKLYHMILDIVRKLQKDYVAVFSAQAAFFIILSFFPFIMFLLTLLRYLPIQEYILMKTFNDILPSALRSNIVLIISEVYDHTSTTVISITAITALWSASKGFLGLVRGLNSVYDIKETRNYFRLRFISTLYTLGFTVLLIFTLLLLVFGNQLYLWIEQHAQDIMDVAILIISLRAIVTLLLLTFFFALMFIVIPNRKTSIMSELPGAIIAATGWLAFSYLYSFYIDNMSNFTSTYGSLTAIVLLMLWVYFCMYILFIGAEFNAYTKNHHLLERLHNNRKKDS